MSKDPFEKEEYIKDPFRNSRGAYRTSSLFLDFSYDADIAQYTLREKDTKKNGKSFPSLKRLYLETEDVTEYEFATTYLAGWKHWQALLGNKQILSHVEQWREELEIKIRSKAVKSIASQAFSKDKPSYQAAKFLADREYVKNRKGAPTKEEVEGEKKRQAAMSDEVAEHIERMEAFH